MTPLRSLADCYEILLANMVRVDLNPRAHGAGYGDALHVDTFCAGWLCFDESLCQCVEVFNEGFYGEAGFADWRMDDPSLVNAVFDLTGFDVGDGTSNVHGNGTGLWVGH